MNEIIFNWLVENKTWFFDGVGSTLVNIFIGIAISIISYSFGKKSCLREIIKHENMTIDYSTPIHLTIGASGAEYTAPNDGCFNIDSIGKCKIFVNGVCVQSIENGVISCNVSKGQKIRIVYEQKIENFIFYYAKKYNLEVNENDL